MSPGRRRADEELPAQVHMGAGAEVAGGLAVPADGGGAWWQRGAIYQIYPRSFADSDDDGVGDLRGLISRLDYLNDGTVRSLGVEAIWLSPFYPSPMADFGYDVADYCDVDPTFGSLRDFDDLVREAHARGIRVVIDLVPNHTSDRHPWFVEARAARDSDHRDWYVWRDPAPGGGPPNNWRSSFPAVGAAWTLDEHSGQYYLNSFSREQPDLNWDNPAVERAMHGVMRFWLERGVDGFRIDVVHKLAKDPELRDDEEGAPPRSEDWEETIHERLRGLRAVVDAYPDRMLVGEVYLLDLHRVVQYLVGGDKLHMAHNFAFLHTPWDARAFRAGIDDFEALATAAAWPAWFLANHDHARVATRYDDGGHGTARARAVLLMLYALRGTPFIYQGEELGLPESEIPPGRLVDLDGRDPRRTPVPWRPPSEAGPGAGFTGGEPWLPIGAAAEARAVSRQEDDPASTLSLARRLAWLRRATPALRGGGQRTLDVDDDVLAWLRDDGGARILAAVNFAEEERPLPVASELPGGARLLISSGHGRREGSIDADTLALAPDEAVLIEL
jgi:alpha-glucosidase